MPDETKSDVAPATKQAGTLKRLGQAFHRYIGWKRVGLAASLLVIAAAIAVLFKLLKGVDSYLVMLAMQEKTLSQVGLAALCILGAYFTLTFYDLFALRTIGRKDVPYRIAALSSFTSYTIGHNLGATVFTGGAIRYRIYSEWGLNAIDVAKICFISGLTFWLGNAFVLGFGMAYHPEAASAVTHLPIWANRAIALACLGGIIAYLGWLAMKPRQIGRNGWKVVLPSAKLTLLQILIGVVDLGFCALAMKILMPESPPIDFMSLSVVFIFATLLGFASHAPGSLGVLEASMLIALPQFGKESLLGTLLVFRLLYFIIPFAIALTIMGCREIWLNIIEPWQRRRRAIEAVACADNGNGNGVAVAVQAVETKPHQPR
jgi:uncharacterized membrane protein YbhN (UPF0104 family)